MLLLELVGLAPRRDNPRPQLLDLRRPVALGRPLRREEVVGAGGPFPRGAR